MRGLILVDGAAATRTTPNSGEIVVSTAAPVCAFALALMAWPLTTAAVAPPVSPSGASDVSAVVRVAAKKSPDVAGQQQRTAGQCTGVYMYWSPRNRKCMDARDKPMARPPGVSPDEAWFPGSKGGDPACMREKAGC